MRSSLTKCVNASAREIHFIYRPHFVAQLETDWIYDNPTCVNGIRRVSYLANSVATTKARDIQNQWYLCDHCGLATAY